MGLKDYFDNPFRVFFLLKRHGLLERWSDCAYTKLMYHAYMGKKLNLQNPVTLNEKLQWLKLFDHQDSYVMMADKYSVKSYIDDKLGVGFTIPTLGVYDSFEAIDFSKLPNQFVLKCTHDSGGLVICRNKSLFPYEKARIKLTQSLSNDFYRYAREWQYKNIPHRIIAEEYVDQISEKGLIDYKFYCFNGKPRFLYVSRGLEDHKTAEMSFYDLKLNRLPFYRADYKQIKDDLEKPKNFSKMIEIATILSAGIPFVRVDLYNIDGKILFSELTFTPNAGLMPIVPKEWDAKLGALLDLPLRK